jgi:hypothetical protein
LTTNKIIFSASVQKTESLSDIITQTDRDGKPRTRKPPTPTPQVSIARISIIDNRSYSLAKPTKQLREKVPYSVIFVVVFIQREINLKPQLN